MCLLKVFLKHLVSCLIGRWVEDHEVVHNMMFNATTNTKVPYKKTLTKSKWWDNGVLPLWITAQNQVTQTEWLIANKLTLTLAQFKKAECTEYAARKQDLFIPEYKQFTFTCSGNSPQKSSHDTWRAVAVCQFTLTHAVGESQGQTPITWIGVKWHNNESCWLFNSSSGKVSFYFHFDSCFKFFPRKMWDQNIRIWRDQRHANDHISNRPVFCLRERRNALRQIFGFLRLYW